VASIHLKVVATSTLPMTSCVVGPHENPITLKFDSLMSKNLNSELKKEESYTYDPSKHGVEGSPGVLGRRPYGERLADCTNYVNDFISN
jgi:hypothetical protein